MITYDEIFSPGDLWDMREQGYVRVQEHPYLPLSVMTYTHLAMQHQKWNDVTVNCRGLVVDHNTYEVVARPFRKFFNWDEPAAPDLCPRWSCSVTDKVDGSLGIVYPNWGGHSVATKGSFSSPQATKASQMWQRNIAPYYTPPEDLTLLVEIVYPENRIVLDYGDQEKLILLGAVEISTGISIGAHDVELLDWPGGRAQQLGFMKYGDFVHRDRSNAEGVVLYFPIIDDRVKFKQEDYKVKHRVVTNVTPIRLWEALRRDTEWDLVNELPEEHREWANSILEAMKDELVALNKQVDDQWQNWMSCAQNHRSHRENRKQFARWNSLNEPWLRSSLFNRYDDKSYLEILLKKVKPSG